MWCYVQTFSFFSHCRLELHLLAWKSVSRDFVRFS